MNNQFVNDILFRHFTTQAIHKTHTIQRLWSGYGEIAKYQVGKQSLIVKHIDLGYANKHNIQHPRGWHSDFGHKRKLSSYRNEMRFYQQLAPLTSSECRVPKLYVSQDESQQLVLVMEDLDAQGFPLRYEDAPILTNIEETSITLAKLSPVAASVIKWLANFHAQFMQAPSSKPIDISGQWPQGSYWHLATRPDEYAKMPDSPLKKAANNLDQQLRSASFQTLIHGDAKIANFCFSKKNGEIAAVDFQYCGQGVGIVDVVYFLGSAFSSPVLTKFAPLMLENYFAHIRHSLNDRFEQVQLMRLEQEWRALYPVAWADFERFLSGWSPNHYKLHTYSRTQTTLAIPPY
ncbi:MAG: aminoglycoside phosphotransferase family protein [Glaciecola sp.]|nr:aminoglycoside phosphotransferase family protein [Glaciecola sp.]MDG1815642.1 aminoglycoside phosphotransferase family protein [Glaciecola sp.]MDG2098161.1 aminoglycoside phosphotransferase family protein [Glaciecola sp.]